MGLKYYFQKHNFFSIIKFYEWFLCDHCIELCSVLKLISEILVLNLGLQIPVLIIFVDAPESIINFNYFFGSLHSTFIYSSSYPRSKILKLVQLSLIRII